MKYRLLFASVLLASVLPPASADGKGDSIYQGRTKESGEALSAPPPTSADSAATSAPTASDAEAESQKREYRFKRAQGARLTSKDDGDQRSSTADRD